MTVLKKALKILAITAFWLGLWWLIALWIGKPALFPSPIRVFACLGNLMSSGNFYLITLRTLGNILLGIVIAVAGAGVTALLTWKVSFLRELLAPLMSVIKATPVASFIVLMLIWIGSAKVPTLITVLIVFPIVWSNLSQGFMSIDPALSQVATVYRFSAGKRWRALILPSLSPHFFSACKSSLGLAWKAGVAAEIIAMPRGTIGTMIGEAKLYIETEAMFAWTLTVILLSLIIEFVFSALFTRLAKNAVRKEAL